MKACCVSPFWSIEVDEEGNVTCCCPDWTDNYFFGNIYEHSYEEIWNGEKIQEFRRQILNNEYPHCNTEMCTGLDERVFRVPGCDDFEPAIVCKPPRFVTLSVEYHCNCVCFMCRSCHSFSDDDLTELLISKIDKVFLPMVKNAEIVNVNGAGEVFCSKFYKAFIRKAVEANKEIKFDIYTNGLLCTPKKIEEFGLAGRMNVITVSLHAATKETYNSIVKYSSFDTVIRNIKYLSGLKAKGKIYGLALTFVLSSKNYRELPDFIEFAKSVNAFANIWPMRLNHLDLEPYNIVDKNHPEHEKLLEVLKKCDFSQPHVRANNEIVHLVK